MLKEEFNQQNVTKFNTPKTFVKRDGSKYPFAIFKLNMVLHNLDLDNVAPAVIEKIVAKLDAADEVNAQDVAVAFRDSLNELGYLDEAKAYVQYRKHDEEEWIKQTDTRARLKRMVNGDPTIVNENANKDSEVFSTQRDLTAGTVGKTVGLTMMPEHIAKAHLRGDIHWHDLDYTPLSPMTNCCLIDFKDMLTNGFKIGNAYMTSPNSINVATHQVTQIITNVASSQYGGCSFDRADEVLAPFAEKNYQKHLKDAGKFIDDPEKLEEYAKSQTKKDIYDAMQGLEYEINTMFSSQGQTPFTTLGFGLGTSWIEKEIQKDILRIRIKGLGRERRTAIFPKLVFTIKKGLNLHPGDPNYDVKQLAIQCSTKRMYPDVLMYDTIKKITGSFKAPMGCRSFLQGWKDENGKEVNSGRMNLGVVTVNLPRIAMESHGDKKLFWEIFNTRMRTCHQALAFKGRRAIQAKPENAPIMYQYGVFGKRLKPGDDVNELFKNGRATISLGYIGLYEVGTGHETADAQGVMDGKLQPFIYSYLQWLLSQENPD